MQSPTAASESCNSNGGSRWLNRTCGAVWLARLPSFSSWRNSLPITMSSSSLNIVLNTTVTLSLLASTYLDENQKVLIIIKITIGPYHVHRATFLTLFPRLDIGLQLSSVLACLENHSTLPGSQSISQTRWRSNASSAGQLFSLMPPNPLVISLNLWELIHYNL